jgi:hypothetical protein
MVWRGIAWTFEHSIFWAGTAKKSSNARALLQSDPGEHLTSAAGEPSRA